MRGAIPPLPNTRPWRGAELKKSTGKHKNIREYTVGVRMVPWLKLVLEFIGVNTS